MTSGGRHTTINTLYARRAHQWARLFSFIPFSRGYFLTGSVARKKAKPESDIDVAVLAHRNYVWLHRALFFIFLFLCGQRRTSHKRSGKFCIALSTHDEKRIEKSFHFCVPLWHGTSPTKALEQLLIMTGVAFVLEHIARALIGRYITYSFSSVRSHPDTVVRLLNNHIEYFPPREGGGVSLDSLTAPQPLFPRIS